MLRRLLSMWPFRFEPLDRLIEPAPLALPGVVVSSNDVVSPLSGMRAAAIVLELLEQVPVVAPQWNGMEHRQPPRPARAYRRADLLVQGQALTVAVARPGGTMAQPRGAIARPGQPDGTIARPGQPDGTIARPGQPDGAVARPGQPDGAMEVELRVNETGFKLAVGAPIAERLPELVPQSLAERVAQARRSCTEGPLCYREQALTCGTSVLLHAHFQCVQAAPAGYRAPPARRLLVRPELGPVVIVEVLERPAW